MTAYSVGMRYLVAFVLLLIVGCTKPMTVTTLVPGAQEPLAPSVTLHMDTDFTTSERASAQEAVDLWRNQTSGLANITLVYDLDFNSLSNLQEHVAEGHHLVASMESWMSVVQSEDESNHCDGCVLGWMNAGGVHGVGHRPIHGAFVLDRIPADMLTAIMVHEFGHVLGVPHVGAIQGVMYPAAIRGRTACLKKPDLVAFCSVNECGNRKMYPCE